MRPGALALAALLAAACADIGSPPAPPVSFPLVNAGFEETPRAGECPRGWGCISHNDPTSFRFFLAPAAPEGGRNSLCVEPVKREPWAFILQGTFDPKLRGRHLRFSMQAKLTDVAGRGAGAVVTAHDGHGNPIASKERILSGTRDWQTLAVDFDVPAEAAEVDVGGVLDGRGRLCIDNARVEVR